MNDLIRTNEAPTVCLAYSGGGEARRLFYGLRGVAKLPKDSAPSILTSAVYLRGFHADEFTYRDWCLDSGAYTARSQNLEIDLQDYIDLCKRLLDGEYPPVEVFSLDVIGDEEATLKNTEEMWRQGIAAIPTYHMGEPEGTLSHLAAEYPKIALGGMADLRGTRKHEFAEQCFARVWPKKIHGFGVGDETLIARLPWHSVDATNWCMGPTKFRSWKNYGQLPICSDRINLRSEVEWWLKMEERVRAKWRPTWSQTNC